MKEISALDRVLGKARGVLNITDFALHKVRLGQSLLLCVGTVLTVPQMNGLSIADRATAPSP